MQKRYWLRWLLVLVIAMAGVLSVGFFVRFVGLGPFTFGDKIYIRRDPLMDTAQTWPIADDLVIKRKSPLFCGNIVVLDPSKRENTLVAVKRCYFEVAERLRDKTVCDNLAVYEETEVARCKENIDDENARDFASLRKQAETVMHLQIRKEDRDKTLDQLVAEFLAPYFEWSALTDKDRKYGHDLEIVLPRSVTSSGEHKILVRLIPQNVEAVFVIQIDNPYQINLPIDFSSAEDISKPASNTTAIPPLENQTAPQQKQQENSNVSAGAVPQTQTYIAEPAAKTSAGKIVVGDHILLPNTPGQKIKIYVTGNTSIEGVNVNVQVEDGGTEAGGKASGPKITDVDITSGTIFSENNTVARDPGSVPQVGMRTVTTREGTVIGNGLLATVTIDTTSFYSGTWKLSLKDTRNGPTDFAGLPIDIQDGRIIVK